MKHAQLEKIVMIDIDDMVVDPSEVLNVRHIASRSKDKLQESLDHSSILKDLLCIADISIGPAFTLPTLLLFPIFTNPDTIVIVERKMHNIIALICTLMFLFYRQ